MLIDVLFTAGLALGQPPAPPPAPAFFPQQVIGARLTTAGQAPAPMVPMQPAQPMPPPGQPMPTAAPVFVEDAPAEAEPTKYLAERLLEGTRIGDFMSNNGIRVYGWTQMSWSFGSASQSNAPLQFVDRAREFLFNQNYIVFEKTIDTSKKEFQLGFRSDTVAFGSDARFSIPRGLFDDQLKQGDLYPWDNVQNYLEFYMPNLGCEGTSVKVGRFYTPVGYESFMATANAFITRSYNFQFNPYTHTGFLTTTYLSEAVSVYYGAVFGSDVFVDPASRLTLLSGFKIAPKDGKNSFAINTVVTNPKYDLKEAFAHYNVYNMVFTHKFNDKLSYAADLTASHMSEFPGTTGAAWWYGAAQYLSYALNDCITAQGRVEVWNDDKGVRTGTAGLYTNVTLATQFKINDSISFTPEVRYDHNNNGPFEGGRKDLFTGAVSLIIRW